MTKSLRVVFVAPFGLRHKTTVWARALPLATELKRLGIEASILVPPWDSPMDAGSIIERDGVTIEHVSLEYGIAGTVAKLLQRIAELSPDIVHILKPRAHAGIIQWLLWQGRRCHIGDSKIILDVDDWEHPWSAINHYPRYLSRFLQWQEEWGIRHADGITAASQWLTRRVSAGNKDRPVLYLPNGVQTVSSSRTTSAHFHPTVLRTPPRILLLTRFVETAPEWLAECWHAIQRQRNDAILLVAGRSLYENGEADFLSALADTSHSKESPGYAHGDTNIAWLGFIPPHELPALFQSVDCAIFPSDDTPLLQAKCSVRLANVLQYGVPTVASRVGEQAYYGGNGASILVPPHASPQEFAAQVIDLLNGEEERAKISATAAERMQNQYNWTLLGHRLADFYEEVGLSQR